MTIDKIYRGVDEALEVVQDGATILVGGFGDAGAPLTLLDALARRRPKDLVVVSNNAGTGRSGVAALLDAGCVRKIVCSYPKSAGSFVFDELYEAGRLELELVPQGTLSERIRAGGAGIAGFYTRTGARTLLTQGREHRRFGDHEFVLEAALTGDVALIRASLADRWGNLTYRKSARNFAPTMAMAATTTIVEATRIVPLGRIDPETVITPGVYVDRVVEVSR